MIVSDMTALAIKTGELPEGSALFDDIQAALGIDETAFAETPYVADATAPAEAPAQAAEPQTSSFQFNNGMNSSQWSPRDQQASASPAPAAQAPAAPARAPTEKERRWADVPLGGIAYEQTATGFRAVPTGIQARREAGVPLGPDA